MTVMACVCAALCYASSIRQHTDVGAFKALTAEL